MTANVKTTAGHSTFARNDVPTISPDSVSFN